MAKYRRRFTRDEFANELFIHLRDLPSGHVRSHAKLAESARLKAKHYARALQALDSATARLRKLAAAQADGATRTETEAAVKEISEAINAYGEASLSGNSSWVHDSDNE